MKGLVLALLLVAAPAAADVTQVDRSVEAARAEGAYAFCTDPPRPLLGRQRGLCPIAEEVSDCEALRDVCRTGEPKKEPPSWIAGLAGFLAPLARVLLYLLVIVIALVIIVPTVQALRRRGRAERVRPTADHANAASLVTDAPALAERGLDPEATLAAADACHRAGDDRRALGLYLAASLAALDRRGALRLRRDRTNGEYVRACADAGARPELRAIVTQVDRVDFGGEAPTDEALTDVAGRARGLVRAAAVAVTVLATLLGLVGCGGSRRANDPAADELPTEVLRRNGFHVVPLTTSLSTMPIEGAANAPVTIVDVERVLLGEEALVHLTRWVEAGGTLVLFGHAYLWPEALGAHATAAPGRAVRIAAENASEDDGVEEDIGGRLARADALDWTPDDRIAEVGTTLYAGKKKLGKGLVLGVANDDLFTNLGVLPAHNGAVLVALVRAAAHDRGREATAIDDVRIARAEDGIPPPSNPFAALDAAGLGKGAWHALAAALVLFLAFGIRHARPRPVRAAARRAFAEHVQATGALYAKSDAKLHALRAYGKFVELRLRELTPRGTDAVAWLAQRSHVPAARIQELLARANAADPELRGDELGLLEELRSIVATSAGPTSAAKPGG